MVGDVYHPAPEAERHELVATKGIVVSDRLRPVSEAHVHFLMGDIYANGLLTRIEVCRDGKAHRLVCGAHRLEACTRLGWTEIPARIVDHAAVSRRAREISENLVRHELSPLDRAAHVGEWYQLQLQAAGVSLGEHKQKVGGLAFAARVKAESEQAGDMMSSAYDLQDQIAEKLGLNVRTIKRDIALYRGLEPDVVDALRDTPVGAKTTQLLRLAKLDRDERFNAVEAIASGKAATVNDALLMLSGGRKEAPTEKKINAAVAAFRKLGAAGQRAFLESVAKDPLPKGFSIAVPTKGGKA